MKPRLLPALLAVFLLSVLLAPAPAGAVVAPTLSINGNTLSWQTVDDADGYNVYLDDGYLTTVSGLSYSTSVDGAYYVTAFDRDANPVSFSGRSNIVRRGSPVTVPSSTGAPVVRQGGSGLVWDAVAGADGYNVYVDGGYLTTVSGLSYATSVEGLYYVTAFDRDVDPTRFSGKSNDVRIGDNDDNNDDNDSDDDTTPTSGLVWGQDTTPESSTWARPNRFTTVEDPAYGTELRRLTNADASRWNRNDYSRRQAESNNGQYVLTHVREFSGTETFRVMTQDGTVINDLAINPDGEPQWHPTNSSLIRHIAGPDARRGALTLNEINIFDNNSYVIADLTSEIQDIWPNAAYMKDGEEGSPSMDGDSYAWIVYNSSNQQLGIVSYDLGQDRILGSVDFVSGVRSLDAVSASPSGRHIVAQYEDATYVYNADMSVRRLINNKADHADIALDANGNDSFVYVDFSEGPDAGYLVSVNLDTTNLQRTRLVSLYGTDSETSIHISGKGYEMPGWVIMSTYSCKEPGGWACDKVFALELVEGGRILNLAHTYNCDESDYYTEAHAVVNRDFTHVYFNSDSASCGRGAEVYQIQVPSFN